MCVTKRRGSFVVDDGERGRRPFLLQDPEVEARAVRWTRFFRGLFAAVVVAVLFAALAAGITRDVQTERRYIETLRADLQRLARAERSYYAAFGTYGSVADLGRRMVPSQGVSLDVKLEGRSWSATARHALTAAVCIVAGDSIGGATTDPPIRCR
jgi:hypothetical protein